ncbi:CPBP family intramembrane glutamic endopeptidase [Staphylospora marina]|uniref:CPBP family intramembrane glutamic endopeptidase n=1 Tax=Staphylospora marina TaxID=2490858 RepID=UPI000F5BF826|nr:CPBP family intramembrane glutamic endopeptidase [Staphylospora marina]
MSMTWELLAEIILFVWITLTVILLNLSEKYRRLGTGGKETGWPAFTLIIVLYSIMFLNGIILSFAGALLPLDPEMTETNIGMVMWVLALLALLLLVPAVRRLLSRWIPIDPENRLHAGALSLSMIIAINLGTTLAFGLEDLSEYAATPDFSEVLVQIWSQNLLFLLISLLGVGWLIRRSGREVLQRLGFTRPSPVAVLKGAGVGLVLMVVAALAEQLAANVEWLYDPHVEEMTEKLLGPLLTSPLGILTLGLAAALGEETLFRGALQPRFGLLPTSVLFTLSHVQYGLSMATLVVFLLGLYLGWVRQREGTVMCMVIHATYNMGLGVLSLYMGS